LSEIRATTISDETGNGPIALTKQSAAKVWINLDGVGTIFVSGSFGVSSAVDNSTGNYTVNLSNNMSDEKYSVSGSSTAGSGAYTVFAAASYTVGSYTMFTSDGGSGQEDKDPVSSMVQGDLA
tara:strand:- start:60 stop:428 length:369 start_codon:yes stop_codon:yes gene_type:complete